MLRIFSCLALVGLLGCTNDLPVQRVLWASPDGGVASVDVEGVDVAGARADSESTRDSAVVDSMTSNAGDLGSLDAGVHMDAGNAIDAQSEVSCIQRAIANGYASCAPGDLYHASCDACTDDYDPVNAHRCKVTVDCLLAHPDCDTECARKCEGIPNNGLVLFCAFKVVSPFCGRQAWLSMPPWGCEKAL